MENNLNKSAITQATLEGKKVSEDWDFARADTSYLTHGLHDYPARMIPQIARRLINLYTQENDKILDPFCGSGTTLVEARLANRSALGNDVNPLAVLLAKVKSTPINFEKAGFNFAEFLSKVDAEHVNVKEREELPRPPLEIYPRLLHWFKSPVARDLEFLYQNIVQVGNPDIQDFLKIVFSDTVFKTSNIDLRSSRFIRILHEKELERFNPDVLGQFKKKLTDSVNRMNHFEKRLTGTSVNNPPAIEVKKGDAKKLPFNEVKFDAAITSPPYGEEKNTVAYARWSKLSRAWLRLNGDDLNTSAKNALGAVGNKDILERLSELPSPTTVAFLKRIVKIDTGRVRDALPFFFDYFKSLEEVYRVLKPSSHYCIVIGNRSIRREPLDMEKVTIELGNAAGFDHVRSFFRKIPVKLIPWTTPTGKTISQESIVVLRRG